MANEFAITQGATFQVILAVQNDDGTAYDTTGLTITAGLRNARSQLIALLPITPGDALGQYSISAATETWPTGRLQGDFRVVNTGQAIVIYTGTFVVNVTPGMTPPS